MNAESYKNTFTSLSIWGRNSEDGRNVTNSASNITWKTDIGAAAQLDFSFPIGKDEYLPNNGDQVDFVWNDKMLFIGHIFKKKIDNNGNISITAYGYSRYLKGTGTYVWPATSSAERFERIRNDLSIKSEIVDWPSYRVPEEITDATTFFDMIKNVMNKTKEATGEEYMLLDDTDVVKHINIKRMDTDLVLGDGDMLTSWSWEHSSEEMATVVQVTHEDNQSKARELVAARSDDGIRKYGPLYHTESISGEVNSAQLQDKANALLKQKEHPESTLKIKALGDSRVRAGTSLYVAIKEIGGRGIEERQRVRVKSCTHNFETKWTMDLEVELI
ncbi:XkdQ/YqbQ family protein [Fructobacillus tropaeoli]|uniref:YqbQ/XkdQ domain-containing protein n=1 Tax=Fructobacillus tropaeoli TaxID=709323 RepID=A0A3F3HBK3_9LACO|nr:hypothetical protein [Fructobacillus tropaeoli]GAP04878.1 hypothetical protein FTRO_0110130 [Fructobacillus tropaeoli]